MQIAIGSDHRGLELKARVTKLVTDAGHQIKDFGAYTDARVDYPNIAEAGQRYPRRAGLDRINGLPRPPA